MIGHKIVLGSAQFGLNYGIANTNGKIETKEVENILLYAKSHQINTIDTAISYGDSEACMGAIGVNGWNIITKLPEVPKTCKNIHSWISSNIQKSLSRLNVTKVDAVLLHNPMQLLEEGGMEIWSSLRNNQSLGTINKIGFSIYNPIELDKLYFKFKPDLVQFPYNIFDRRIEDSGWLKILINDKVETHARSVFLQGLLLIDKNNRPKKFLRWKDLWTIWDDLLVKKNITALQACMDFVFMNENIDKIVIGVDSKSHLKEIIAFKSTNCLNDFMQLSSNDLDLINPSRWNNKC